jgi:endonuclease/exonuclease/phosphatase family metal-dependent hydrolase
VAEADRERVETAAAAEFQPIIVNRKAWPQTDMLRVVAFNARWGLRLEEIVACLRRPPLKGAGVILLAEADWNLRRSHNRDVAAEIAKALEMSFVYAPEFAPRSQMPQPVSFLGNAILSAYPLAEARTVALPNYRLPSRARRLVGSPHGAVAVIKPNGRALTVGVAHLNSRTGPMGRAHQMARYLEDLEKAGPAVIGGDFNTTTVELAGPREMIKAMLLMALRPGRFRKPMRYEPLFARMAAAGFQIDGANAMSKGTFTFSGAVPRWARPKLDWIGLRGLEAARGSGTVVAAKTGLLGRRISDHDFVMCEVRV